MTIAETFRKAPAAVVTQADFQDFSTGVGYQQYFLMAAIEESTGSAVTNLILSDLPLYSNNIVLSGETTGGDTDTKIRDDDFDTPMKVTRVISGNVIVNIPLAATNGEAAAVNTQYIVVRLKSVTPGNVETLLGTAESRHRGQANGETEFEHKLMQFEVTDKKIIAGNTLRLTVEVWAQQVNGSSTSEPFSYGIDPKNRNASKDIDYTNSSYTHFVDGNPTESFMLLPIKQLL